MCQSTQESEVKLWAPSPRDLLLGLRHEGGGPRAAVPQWTVSGGSPILAPQATSRVSSYTAFLRLILPPLQPPVARGWMSRRGTSAPAKLPKPWVVCFHFVDLRVPKRLTAVPTGLGHEEGGHGPARGSAVQRMSTGRALPHWAPGPLTHRQPDGPHLPGRLTVLTFLLLLQHFRVTRRERATPLCGFPSC